MENLEHQEAENYIKEEVEEAIKAKYEHHITDSIRSYYRKQLIWPAIYLCLLALLLFVSPLSSFIYPVSIDSESSLSSLDSFRTPYVNARLTDLYFTGYTKNWLGQTDGYYYYTMIGNDVVIVLINGSDCAEGISKLDSAELNCKVIRHSMAEEALLSNLAGDLAWTDQGISSTISGILLSEPAATGFTSVFLRLVIFITGAYALFSLIYCLLCILNPFFSRAMRKLSAYGDAGKLLTQAEEELSTLPQLATEDMFITEHFFIETSGYGVAVVPIDQIIWIYKYSTLHKFLWHHFMISYTLHITAKHRHYLHCPKNTKTDIDGIMEYLAEANHNILVGFSEENRLAAEKMQGEFVPLQKFLTFLSKRV